MRAICQQASVVKSFRLLQRIFFKTTFDNKDLPCLQWTWLTRDIIWQKSKPQKIHNYSQYKTQETIILYISSGTLNFEVRLAQESTTKNLSEVSMVKNSGSCSFKARVEAIWSLTHHSTRLLFLITVSNPFNTATMFLVTSWSCDAALTLGLQAGHCLSCSCSFQVLATCRELRPGCLAFFTDQLRHNACASQVFIEKTLNYLAQLWLFKKVVLISDGCAAQFVKTYSSSPQPYTHLSGSQSTEKVFFGSHQVKWLWLVWRSCPVKCPQKYCCGDGDGAGSTWCVWTLLAYNERVCGPRESCTQCTKDAHNEQLGQQQKRTHMQTGRGVHSRPILVLPQLWHSVPCTMHQGVDQNHLVGLHTAAGHTHSWNKIIIV